jgi:hypothetical protein
MRERKKFWEGLRGAGRKRKRKKIVFLQASEQERVMADGRRVFLPSNAVLAAKQRQRGPTVLERLQAEQAAMVAVERPQS